MKLDNKGFAISGILYAVMILFLTLIVSLLAMISNRKLALDNYKKTIKSELNDAASSYGARVQIAPDTTYVRIGEDEIVGYDVKKNVSGCIAGTDPNPKDDTLCHNNETDITNLVNYRIYDEVGNEVLEFNSDPIYSLDGYKVDIAYYTYNEKDSDGNYVLDSTKTKLKVVTKYLTPNVENIFYVRYHIVDKNNVLSQEATRTLVIKKYNNYIKVVNSLFKIGFSEINTSSFRNKILSAANNYVYSSGELTLNNTPLDYAIYNPADEKITEFYHSGGSWHYRTDSSSAELNTETRFRIRYFTGTLDNPTAEVNFAYFMFE